jgi:hypothetical protein
VPARRDLDVYRGDTWTHEIRFVDALENPVDVSAWVFASQVRRSWKGDIVVPYSVDASAAAAGVVVFFVGAPDTELDPGSYRYDVERTQGGVVETVLKGRLVVTGDITQ